MRFLLLVCVILATACGNHKPKESGSYSSALRFDGLYKSAVQTNKVTGDKSTSYLRFYNDGTVINVSSSGTPEQIKDWFIKGHDNVLQTTYHETGTQLNFAFHGSDGELSYDGKIADVQQLQLHTKNSGNNHEDNVTYTFVEE